MFIGALPHTGVTPRFVAMRSSPRAQLVERVLCAVRTGFQRVLFSSCYGRNFALRWLILLLHLCPLVGNGSVCCLLPIDESYGTSCGSPYL